MLPVTLQIHWFSIINSCVTVLLLTGFLATILMRVLKKDFVKYARDDEGMRFVCMVDVQRMCCMGFFSAAPMLSPCLVIVNHGLHDCHFYKQQG